MPNWSPIVAVAVTAGYMLYQGYRAVKAAPAPAPAPRCASTKLATAASELLAAPAPTLAPPCAAAPVSTAVVFTTSPTPAVAALPVADALADAYVADVRRDVSLTTAQADATIRVLLELHELHERRAFDALRCERAIVGVVISALRLCDFDEAEARDVHLFTWMALYEKLQKEIAAATRMGTRFPSKMQRVTTAGFVPRNRPSATPAARRATWDFRDPFTPVCATVLMPPSVVFPRASATTTQPELLPVDALSAAYVNEVRLDVSLTPAQADTAIRIVLDLHEHHGRHAFDALLFPGAVVGVVVSALRLSLFVETQAREFMELWCKVYERLQKEVRASVHSGSPFPSETQWTLSTGFTKNKDAPAKSADPSAAAPLRMEELQNLDELALRYVEVVRAWSELSAHEQDGTIRVLLKLHALNGHAPFSHLENPLNVVGVAARAVRHRGVDKALAHLTKFWYLFYQDLESKCWGTPADDGLWPIAPLDQRWRLSHWGSPEQSSPPVTTAQAMAFTRSTAWIIMPKA